MHNVKIKMTDGTPTAGKVEIDGREIKCRRVELIIDLHSKPILTLEILPEELEIETSATVFESTTAIGDAWKNFKLFERR